MAGNEDDAFGDKIVRHGDRLLRIAGIVADAERQILAEDAALGVDVLHRPLGTVLHLIAERRIFARHRASSSDV